jgi:hypothetical protein
MLAGLGIAQQAAGLGQTHNHARMISRYIPHLQNFSALCGTIASQGASVESTCSAAICTRKVMCPLGDTGSRYAFGDLPHATALDQARPSGLFPWHWNASLRGHSFLGGPLGCFCGDQDSTLTLQAPNTCSWLKLVRVQPKKCFSTSMQLKCMFAN